MDYFKKLIEKSEKNYISENLGQRSLGINNMRKIKILPFQCGSPSPAFRPLSGVCLSWHFSSPVIGRRGS
jgi:hypothetical protein